MPGSPSPRTDPFDGLGRPIDRESPVPFYFQLRSLLQAAIEAGHWGPGARLPTESELCTQFGVSRSTVRQALGAMESDGIVERRKGLGTYVAEARAQSWLVQSSDGVFQQDATRGHHLSSEVLRSAVEPMPSWATDALGLPEGEHGVRLERLRRLDGRVALYVVHHLLATTAVTIVGADLATTSLYELLQREHGLAVHGAHRTLQAVEAGDRLAAMLEVPVGGPLVFIESVSWDRDERPFDAYRAWLRTDRMSVEIGVTAINGGPDRAAITPEHS